MMNSTALTVWHSFLRAAPPDRQNALLARISPELTQEFQDLSSLSVDLYQDFTPIEEELSRIHYSWLSPVIRSLPENEIKLFLSALPIEQMKGLKQSLLLSNTLPTPSPMARAYIKKTLFEMISKEDLLPIALLPSDPLNTLLELAPSELSSLIDLLSMHDLSTEVRHVIETVKLKEIYSLLSKAQATFLKTLLHKKEAVSFKKMGLLAWDGDKDALRSLLLQRGLNRIAKALHNKSPSLLWYVAHRLHAEQGRLLIKLCTGLDHPKASSLLNDQVVELISSLKPNYPPEKL